MLDASGVSAQWNMFTVAVTVIKTRTQAVARVADRTAS